MRSAGFNQSVTLLFYVITKGVIKIEIGTQNSFTINLVSDSVASDIHLMVGPVLLLFNISVFYIVF